MMASYYIMKALLFFEKNEIDFFYLDILSLFLFFILYFKNQCNILYL